ncbi:hypothetical protein [Vibrio neptunius]|uniref:BIG2 domain-containing protein n=1 Tax=Vibrio neptunius TaxID=170651 RepID=A0ABS3A9I5_9VIBR|nr:hypothetical protein [Vibrio neptunius]MBN3495579.1 hypothetical protein [Vibrio neptunius]MBN3518059.1 hypothetical protein [Vibrio neptunius]MBN3552386.1 hypothetical protein [Vibrio neptunius]MBN3580422.1 hypothetical protein [Vibrio neptunius]MCH9874089.1 hypothetical protein [Vibrio neptunius]
MLGLSGCSEGGETTRLGTEGAAGDTQDSSPNNQDSNNGNSPSLEDGNPSDENNGGSGGGDNSSGGEGGSGGGDNSSGGEGGSGGGDNSSGGEGGSGDDDTPTDSSKLHIRFTRPAPPANSAPHVQRQNQELSGRPFQLEVYSINDELNLQEVTTEVTWTMVDENCGGEPCYTLSPEGRLVAGAIGQFSVQAEYNGLLSPVVSLETPRKLETCGVEGNTDMNHQSEECLHIIAGSSGSIAGKWFTEPPRPLVMRYMYYTKDDTPYNSGYTHSDFWVEGGSGTNAFASMRNDGYDASIENTSRIDAGDFGQSDRYCRDLASIKFNGRDNWRRPYQQELEALSTLSIKSNYGWPVNVYYASSNVHISGGKHKLRYVLMREGSSSVSSFLPGYDDPLSLSPCVSEEP